MNTSWIVLGLGVAPIPPSLAGTFHVDAAQGDDTRDGLSLQTA